MRRVLMFSAMYAIISILLISPVLRTLPITLAYAPRLFHRLKMTCERAEQAVKEYGGVAQGGMIQHLTYR